MDLIIVNQLITQILGFLVVLWILRAFAWKPLLKVLEDRRQKIADDFAAAGRARAEMEALKADFEARIREIESTARQRITEAAREGERLSSQIVEEGRERAREQLERATAEIVREKEKALAELREQMVRSVIAATERVVQQKLDDAGHRSLIERFLSEVEGVR
ncbi:MAG TPA: F0F1 ATP synthase subunit B [Candidatus Saccharimonadales bacterium]|nr:F0F1 ATP synthase subunit B [Candidatus Saccharimonadales bacterium]